MQRHGERGYAMAALLAGMSVMAILMSVALPVWTTAAQREREAELVFRGEQYAQAISLFQRRTGGYPPSLDVLAKTRAIRKLYKDPITGGDFQPVFVGQMIGGVPVAPGQPGGQAPGQAGRGAGGRAGQPGPASGQTGRGVAAGPVGRGQAPAARGAGGSPFTGGGVGQAGFGTPQNQTAGPIIGVVSRSAASSLRLYNGRGKYNEWAFVAIATSQQAGGVGGPAGGVGGPAGQTGPGGPRGQGPRGRGPQQPPRGQNPGQLPRGQNPGRGGLPFPGRGLQQPGRGGFPGPPSQ